LLMLAFIMSLAALLVARRLHLGYVGALEGSLQRRAGHLPDPMTDDAAALLQTVGAFDLSGIRTRVFGISSTLPRPDARPAPVESIRPETPLDAAIKTRNAPEVRHALEAQALAKDQVETAIDLLAWNEVAPDAIRALSNVAGSNTPVLVRHLLDPDEDFAIRRRLVNALAGTRTVEAFDGLFAALHDRRFEVRYRAGRALSAMEGEIPGLRVDREQVLEVVQREIAVDRGIWETRQLIDNPADEPSPMEAELLQVRASRSLEHLFTLLSLILPRDTLRLAFHGLNNGDAYLRGTALEYLETVLPENIWAKLWPLLTRGEQKPVRSRNPEQAVQNLLATEHSISMSMAAVRRKREQ
jgi:hypothetical protein